MLVPRPPGALSLSGTAYQLDTTSGVISTAEGPLVVGPGIASTTIGDARVIALGRFEMTGGATLRITGSLALILLVDGNVTIANGSTIDLGGGCGPGMLSSPRCGGPGGGQGGDARATPATGCGPGTDGVYDGTGAGNTGGGGGGGGTAGATSAPDINSGRGGAACGSPLLTPLTGGSGGGAGGLRATGVREGGLGGGGGGAIQITAAGELRVDGVIDAGGAGGGGGNPDATSTGGGGGGGGAGGGVLLEASTLIVTGTIAANGGGGGDSKGTNGAGRGQRGQPSRMCADGGASTAGVGGKGGCAGAPPTSAVLSGDDRGGGGGAAGRIALRGLAPEIVGTISPAATVVTPELE